MNENLKRKITDPQHHYNIYGSCNLNDYFTAAFAGAAVISTTKKIKYYNIPASFDTEFTSFYHEGVKVALVYAWMIDIAGEIIVGRSLTDFVEFMNALSEYAGLSKDNRLIIYSHVLSVEFQFIRKYFTWEKVFAVKQRTPVYAITTTGIEFRCSYILSGYSLEYIGNHKLFKYKVHKQVGKLDYSLMRHEETPLSDDEILYCIYDVAVVVAYIQECIEDERNITEIPLTKTGYARRFCRQSCLPSGERDKLKRIKYKQFIHSLNLDVNSYLIMKRAFMGGYTHANAFYVDQTLTDVCSYDICSSYPAVMLTELYPASSPMRVEIKNRRMLNYYMERYCCLFVIHLYDVCSKSFYGRTISSSKPISKKGCVVDNGRIISADYIQIAVTDVDYRDIHSFYDIEHEKIGICYVFRKDYLPIEFQRAILSLYRKKNELKGVEGAEQEYQHNKEWLNACYGMSVTNDIDRDIIEYGTETWEPVQLHIVSEADITKYNMKDNRFLFYAWGLWVTAYARHNLFRLIHEFGDDFVYSDTDSVKGLNMNEHVNFISEYNAEKTRLIETSLKRLNLDLTALGKTKKGDIKIPGVYEYEGTYNRFKTLGAKRYLTDADGNIGLTVAGLGTAACDYMISTYGSDGVFDAFTSDLYIPQGHTGKMTHTYLDDEIEGMITDYMGITIPFKMLSGLHLEPADYSLNAKDALEYLLGVREDEN